MILHLFENASKIGPPPGYPWQDLFPLMEASSYLCFYYSSPFSARAVRDVNRIVPVGGSSSYVADCKVDPNWETQTFGLFSTCQEGIRRGVVKNRAPYLFFFGNHVIHGQRRGVSGYYKLRWYAHGGTYMGDYCLAAERIHFVEQPLAFEEINAKLGTRLSNRVPRLSMKLTPVQSQRLVELLHLQKDVTPAYVDEIHRLEQINARNAGGLKYINFGRRYSYNWTAVTEIKGLGHPSGRERLRNSGPLDFWLCEECQTNLVSRSLLKLCPSCGAQGTLHAVKTT